MSVKEIICFGGERNGVDKEGGKIRGVKSREKDRERKAEERRKAYN